MGDRTLAQILDAIKDNGKADYEELRYALLAVDALRHLDARALQRLRKQVEHGQDPRAMVRLSADESYRTVSGAMRTPPKAWLGPNHDPENPEYQAVRKAAFNTAARLQRDNQGPTNG